MNRYASSLLLLAAMTGCNKSEQGSQSANPGAPNPAVSPTVNTPSPTNGTTPPASSDMTAMPPATGPSAAEKMKAMSASASDSMKDMGSNISDTAQKYLDQVNEYTKDKKYDLADGTMAKLQALKGKLPADWQDKITSAQQSLDNARKG